MRQFHFDTSVYSGFDTNTREKECCWCCHKSPVKLVRCGRCHLAHYCDRECQKEHFSDHKKECKSVFQATKKLEIRDREFQSLAQRKNALEMLFGTEAEMKSRDCTRASFQRVGDIRKMAYRIETKSLWNEVLEEQLNLARDYPESRDDIPSVFLALNRDDDCYKFIRSCVLKSKDKKTVRWENDTTTDRYGDPLENKQRLRISLSHLVALSVVKMRIVAAYEAHVKVAKDILPFDDLIRENIVKMSVCDDIERQKALRKKYLRMVHKVNKNILQSFANPRLMREQIAEVPLDNYYRHVLRVPGAQDCINDFLKDLS